MANFFESASRIIEELSPTAKAYFSSKRIESMTSAMNKVDEESKKKREKYVKLYNNEKDPTKKKVLADMISSLGVGRFTEELEQEIANLPSKKQVLADTAINMTMLGGGSAFKLLQGAGKVKGVFNVGQSFQKADRLATISSEAKKSATYLDKYNKLSTAGKVLEKAKGVGSLAVQGAGMGALSEVAMNRNASNESILKSAVTFGGLSGGLGVLGVGAGLVGKGINKISPRAEELYEKGISKLDEYSKSGKLAQDDLNKLSNQYLELPQNVTQKIAGGIVGATKTASKIKSRFLDSKQAIRDFEDKIYKLKGGSLSGVEAVYRDFRLATGDARALSATKINNFEKNLSSYSDVRDDAMRYMVLEDAVDRAKLGQLERLVNGKTTKISVEQAQEELITARAALEAKGTTKRVDEVRQKFNQLNREELESGVAEGIYDKESVDRMLEDHPDYIPHNVILDEQERHLRGTLNTASSDVKKAVGSVRKIQDPFEAYKARLQVRSNLVVNNRNNRSLVDTASKYNIGGFQAVRTAEQVTKRSELIGKLSDLKGQKQVLLRAYKLSNNKDKAVLDRINKLSDDIDKADGEVKTWMEDFEKNIFDQDFKPSEVGENYSSSGYLDEFKIADKKEAETLLNKLKLSNKKLTEEETKKLASETNLDDLLQQMETKNGELKSTWKDLSSLKTVKPKSGEETISFYRNGIREDWIVPSDIAEVIKKTDSVQALNVIGNVSAGATNLWKMWTTTLNPVFQLSNKLRDVQTAAITAKSLIQEMVQKYGRSDTLVGLSEKEIDELFKSSGVIEANISQEGKSQFLTAMEKNGLAKTLDNAKDVGDNVVNFLESSTRKEVFKDAIRSGLDAKSAALVARDATIDFEKAGTWMKDLNKIFPFLNARVQGTANTIAAATRNPEMFVRQQAITSLYPSLVLDRWNSQFESNKDIDQDTKNRYWIIQIGEQEYWDDDGVQKVAPQFVTIPKGEGQQLVSNPIQYFLSKQRGTDPRMVNKMILDTLGGASPLDTGTLGFNGKNPLLSIASMNPVTSVVTGLATNKNPYFQTPIISPYLESKNIYNYEKYGKNTPEVLKNASKIMFDAGILDVSPKTLEFLVKSAGGLPTDILKGISAVSDASSEKDTSLTGTPVSKATQIPVFRGFIRESNPLYGPQQKADKEAGDKIEKEVLTKEKQRDDLLESYFESLVERYHEYGENFEDPNFREYAKGVATNITDEEFEKVAQRVVDYSQGINGRVGDISSSDQVTVRVAKIMDKIKGMNSEEKKMFFRQLDKQGILTDDVAEQIVEQQKAD
jgi:hypothetical protein